MIQLLRERREQGIIFKTFRRNELHQRRQNIHMTTNRIARQHRWSQLWMMHRKESAVITQ